jgi:CHAT domain-containing protein
MTRFYEELRGEPVNTAAAVRRTMLAVREQYPHPYYWAPFVLAGDFERSSYVASTT